MKLLCTLVACVSLVFMSSCIDINMSFKNTPYGLWVCKSDGFDFTLDINPELHYLKGIDANSYTAYTKRFYSGEYTENDTVIPVLFEVFTATGSLDIFSINPIDGESNSGEGEIHTCYTVNGAIDYYISDRRTVLSTQYRIVNGRLRLHLNLPDRERYGIDYLYLDLIEEYDKPDVSIIHEADNSR